MPKPPRDLSAYSSDELIEDYVEISQEQEQEQAANEFNTRRYNKIFDELMSINDELKVRPGDQRSLLMALYRHVNPKVRLNAATSTLALAPQAARAVIEEIVAARLGPLSLEAGMCLWTLDKGVFKPS